jgi:hypothetical protein
VSEEKYCEQCKHFRKPVPPAEPFSAEELANPAIVEQWNRWQEILQERQRKEMAQYAKGYSSFPYEPWFVPWCEYYSALARKEAAKEGRSRELFVLAWSKNPNHACPDFAPRDQNN